MKVVINSETGNTELHTTGTLIDVNHKTELANSNGTLYHLGTAEIDVADPTSGEVVTMRPTVLIYKASLYQNDTNDGGERHFVLNKDGGLIPQMEVGSTYPVRMIDTGRDELLVTMSHLTQGERIAKTGAIANLLASAPSQVEAAEAEA